MNILKLALRGLLRNRRRSMVTLLAIAFGFAAIALFAGYTHNVYSGLERGSIHGGLLGHLTISRKGMSREGKLDPEHYMWSGTDVSRITTLLRDEPEIQLIAPRLALSGLFSNERASTIFIAEGISPEAMEIFQENLLTREQERSGLYASMKKRLDPAHPNTILVSQGLAEMLHLKTGDTAALLTNTLTGQANAMDATVGALINTGNANLNDKFTFISLELAQILYDMPGGADRLTVLLHHADQTEAMRERLQSKLKAAGYDVEIKTWKELSDFYTQVHNLFDMIFGFIFSIVLTVIVMSVANSMGMTVVERTREIGTLRAMGLKRMGVIRLFTVESLLLSLLGCAAGFGLAMAVRYGVNAVSFSYIPPNSDSPVLLLVDLDIPRIAFTGLMMLLVGTVAAYLPARRAANQPIINALGHV